MAEPLLDQIVYRWAPAHLLGPESQPAFGPVATTFLDMSSLLLWHSRLTPWLRTDPNGTPPANIFYAVFGEEAALVHRRQPAGARSATARVLIEAANVLTPALALKAREDWSLDQDDSLPAMVTADDLTAFRALPPLEGHPADLARVLVPLLSQILAGRTIGLAAPSTVHPPPRAVLWALQEILGALAEGAADIDRWTPSFATYEDRRQPPPPAGPGPYLVFRPDAADPSPDPFYLDAARALVNEYVKGGVRALSRLLADRRILDSPDFGNRTGLTLARWPPGNPLPETPMPGPPPPASDGRVICPICLGRMDWDELPLHRFDPQRAEYAPLEIPESATPELRARLMRTAVVRCPGSGDDQVSGHYLPEAYGRYATPVVLGFVGATLSGKTHLLAAMVGAIEQGGLSSCGVQVRPVDLQRHQALLRDSVRPFLAESKVLAPTREGLVGFVDAFLITEPGRTPRPVALFDVAGGELIEVDDAKRFLDIADGLIFVVDPEQFGQDGLGDVTFGTVLGLLEASGRLPEVSAAVVLNKADMLRFDDPITGWLRRETPGLDAGALLEESADVYAYLHSRGAQAWARPYRECRRATLHVASAAGSAAAGGDEPVFPRGVAPRRVLGPLIAMLAMTGVLTSGEAAKVGI